MGWAVASSHAQQRPGGLYQCVTARLHPEGEGVPSTRGNHSRIRIAGVPSNMTTSQAPPRAISPAEPVNCVMTVHLLGGPWVTVGDQDREVPEGSKRLLAFLALDRRPLDRHYVAGTLWPDSREDRACACLRTSLWRLRQATLDVVEGSKVSLCLRPHVRVDAEEAADWADRVLGGVGNPEDLRPMSLAFRALDLLPGWVDEWVTRHRERLRQRVLHALDEVGRTLCLRREFAQAIEVASAAVDADPLRESAQRVLAGVHLAEGNLIEARRVFARFERLVGAELGVRPSADFHALVGLGPVTPA